MAEKQTAICTIANDDFMEGAIAWVNSVKHHAPGFPIKIIDGGLSDISVDRLQLMGADVVRTKRVIDYDHPRFGPAYALFDLGYIESERYVYLDCDTIVVGSLQELVLQAESNDIAVGYANAHLHLTNPDYVLSAASVVDNNDEAVRSELTQHAGLIERLASFPSLNTGVVVGSTKVMREIADHAMQFKGLFPVLKNPDQELLSIVLASLGLLPGRVEWRNNATYIHGTKDSSDGRLRSIFIDYMSRFNAVVSDGVYLTDRENNFVENVNVVHFLTKDKPWIIGNFMNPDFRGIWQKYRSGRMVSKTPKISIVVVTWNNENYIEQALESCFSSGLADYEVVVVHNASTDRTKEAIERAVVGNEHLVTVIENEVNVGLGEGRNIGVQNSLGEYILFLDGDDWFEPRGLAQLQEALETSPDLVLLNYARVNVAGDVSPNKLTGRMKKGLVKSPQERKVLFPILGVAWNKCYRRNFLLENELEFPTGFYEDIDWNFKSLILSQRLFVSPEIAVYYRQRSGSILNSADERHFDAIQRHEALMDFIIQSDYRVKNYGRDVYRYARGQLFVVIAKGDRLPKNLEREYLRRASVILKKYRRAIGERRLSFMERVAQAHSGRLLRAANAVRPKLKPYSKWLKQPRKKLQWAAKMTIYKHVFLRLPVRKRVVYDAYWGEQVACNPFAIYQGLVEVGGYSHVWPLKDVSAASDVDRRHVVPYASLRALKAMATASHLVTNVNFPDWYVKRPNQKVLQTHHGTPYKFMGLDIRKTMPSAMNWWKFAHRVGVWDYAISSNPYSTSVWRRAMPQNYRVIETGYPRNDIFYSATPESVARIRERLGVPAGRKLALYAPTFLDWDQSTSHSTIIKLISESLGPDWLVIFRLHHLSKGQEEAAIAGALDVSLYPQVNEICLVADLLVTDFSSIVFDFANTGRPAVLYLEKVEEYRARRGLYFDPGEASPGLVCTSLRHLEDQLVQKEFEGLHARENAQSFRKRFCPWDDGGATQRVLKEVFDINISRTPDSAGK